MTAPAPSAAASSASTAPAGPASLRDTTAAYLAQEAKIMLGGGKAAIERQHEKGRLTARERIARLVDPATGIRQTASADGGSSPRLPSAESRIPNFQELALWSAFNMYQEHGGAPAAGVVTGIGMVQGRRCMIIANDATVKAGAFFPMTCKKIIRAQQVALMARLPLIYLVDSAGVFLPLQEDVFPDTDDFGRIFRNNAVISAEGIPQIAAIMGFCVAGGGYLPVLCDTLLMTEGSGLYLAGQALVKAAIGQDVTDEELGGAKMHAAISGTIDFREKDDEACIARVCELVSKYPPSSTSDEVRALRRMTSMVTYRSMPRDRFNKAHESAARLAKAKTAEERASILADLKADQEMSFEARMAIEEAERTVLLSDESILQLYKDLTAHLTHRHRDSTPPARDPHDLYTLFADKPGAQHDVRDLLACIVDARGVPNADGHTSLAPDFDEYKSEYGQSIVCGYARLGGHACGIVANQKKMVQRTMPGGKAGPTKAVQMPGVIYDDSADKAARFIMDCNQRKIPLIFLHDTTGFMVGRDSEQGGIIRSGAKMVNAMSNCIVPKIVVILGGSYGAGNYAMCGRAFDPFLTFAWPGSRCAVMGAAQASGTLAMIEERSRERKGEKIDEATHKAILDAVRASYNEQQDIRHGAARGWLDRIIEPHRTREELIAALDAAAQGWDYTKPFRTGVLQT